MSCCDKTITEVCTTSNGDCLPSSEHSEVQGFDVTCECVVAADSTGAAEDQKSHGQSGCAVPASKGHCC